jgi:hypothetical protein
MVGWTNKFAEAHPTPEEKAPKGRPRKWLSTKREELYTYFGAVIYMGLTVEPSIED